LSRVSLECGSLRVTVDISKDLKAVVGEERGIQGSRKRDAVPPPATEEVYTNMLKEKFFETGPELGCISRKVK
jgi:hypothetical protein